MAMYTGHVEPQSYSDWAEWIKNEQSNRLKAYCAVPSQLIADFRRERGITRDYEGREILEMLQNSSDAAKATDENGRVYSISLMYHYK